MVGQLRSFDTNGLTKDHKESRQRLARALQNGEWSVQRDATLIRTTPTTQSKRTRKTKPEQTSTRPSPKELHDESLSVTVSHVLLVTRIHIYIFLFFGRSQLPSLKPACAHLFSQPLLSSIGGSILYCDATSIQASGRDRELEQCQHCECAKTHSWLSWQSKIRGRSRHELSLLHMAERIPEGT